MAVLTINERIEIKEWIEDYNNNHIKNPICNRSYKIFKELLNTDEKFNDIKNNSY